VCYANVDQLKRLELEAGGREHRLRLVTDSVGSPIIHFDRNLKLRFANKPFGDWIGVAPDDLLGRRMQELIAGGTFADMDEHIDRAFGGAKVMEHPTDVGTLVRHIRGGKAGTMFALRPCASRLKTVSEAQPCG
jgi:PAS domain S-box-containing protein